MTQAYPLHWPQGMPRTTSRDYSRFRTGVGGAIANVTRSLRAFANDSRKDIVNLCVSSNATLLRDDPRDPGAAVYFTWDNIDCCIAVDRYPKIADNLQAIHHIIEAERVKLRHGGLNIVRAGFRGFAALPPPKDASGQLAPPWRQVLFGDADTAATIVDVERRYRELIKEKHPDRGGDAGEFNAVIDAVRQARQELAA